MPAGGDAIAMRIQSSAPRLDPPIVHAETSTKIVAQGSTAQVFEPPRDPRTPDYVQNRLFKGYGMLVP